MFRYSFIEFSLGNNHYIWRILSRDVRNSIVPILNVIKDFQGSPYTLAHELLIAV
jgi:hypothetical protein